MTTTLSPNLTNQAIENKGRFNVSADLGSIAAPMLEDTPFDDMVKAKAPEKTQEKNDLAEKPTQNHAQTHAMSLRAAKYTKPADQETVQVSLTADTTKAIDPKIDSKVAPKTVQKIDSTAPQSADNTDISEKTNAPIEADPNKVVVEVPNTVGYSVETLRNLLADGLQDADVAPLEQLQLNPTQDAALNPALATLQSLVKEVLAQADKGSLELPPQVKEAFSQLNDAKTDSDVLQALNTIFKLFSARFQESNPGQAIKQFVSKLELKLPPALLAKLADVPMLRAFAKKDVITGQDLNRALRTLVGLSLQDQTHAADYSLQALVPQPKAVVVSADNKVLETLTENEKTSQLPTLPTKNIVAKPVTQETSPTPYILPTQTQPNKPAPAQISPVVDRDSENEQIIFEHTSSNRSTTAPSRNEGTAKAKPAENRHSNVDNSALRTLASAAKNSAFAVAVDSSNSNPLAQTKLDNSVTQSVKLATVQSAAPSPATAQVALYIQRAAGKVQQMTVQLNPAELGRVDIKMVAKPDGTTQVVLQVERPDTFLQLQKDTTHLEKMLQQAGLSTNAGDLTFQLKNQDQADQQAFGKQGQKPGSHNANGTVGTDIANETTEIDSSTLNLALGLRRVDYSA